MTMEPWWDSRSVPAPDFTLRLITQGESSGCRSLSDWRGRRILLVFIQPGCQHCKKLLPAIAGLESNPAPGVAGPIVITSGTEAQIRRLVAAYRLRCPVLVQDDTEVAAVYQAHETPAGCLIDENGRMLDIIRTGAINVLIQAGITPGPGWSWSTTPYRSAGDRFARLCAERARAPLPGLDVEPSDSRANPVEEQDLPLVSVILATRDRSGLLSIALECYRRQTYPHRELIVVDDGGAFPADETAIAAAGGRVIRMPEGTSLGAKLNRGASEARGPLCQKWDDDDWYAPDFLNVMVDAYLRHNAEICRPTVAYQRLHIWFDLERWQVLEWPAEQMAGSTLLFAREDWEEHPFRPVGRSEDVWFAVDQMKADASPALVEDGASYVCVRHGASSAGRGHAWGQWGDGQPVETHLRAHARECHDPAEIFPAWALATYTSLRDEAARQTEKPPVDGRSERPRLLFLTPVAPGFSTGERGVRAGMVLQALTERYDVYLIVVHTAGARAGQIPGDLASLCKAWTVLDLRKKASEQKVREVAAWFGDVRFDVIHCLRLSTADYAAPYLGPGAPGAGRPAWHLDLEGVESLAHQEIADRYRSNGEKSKARYEREVARQLAAVEAATLPRCDRVYVCSQHDREHVETLYALQDVHILPNAVRIPVELPPMSPSEVFTFLFAERLDHYPSEDAVLFLRSEILPRLRRRARQPFTIAIVGSDSVPNTVSRARLPPEAQLIGKVKRMEPWYQLADAVLAPLRTTGGTRIKIIEAMSFRRPVVTTSAGVEGLDVVDGEHVLVGDAPEMFVSQCLRLMSDPRLAARLASNAFDLCARKYSPAAVGAALVPDPKRPVPRVTRTSHPSR
jgi:glycosyltransferase involved in cell wall biosynthesis